MKTNPKSRPPEELQNFLDLSQPGQAQVPASEALAETRPTEASLRRALEAAGWLQARQAGLEPPQGFLPVSRRRLVERIHTRSRRSWWDSAWARPQVRLALNSAALALLLVTLVIFNLSLFTAAQVALPGEVLHPFKLGLENARLLAATSDAQKASLHVAFARERSNELQALLLENNYTNLEISSVRVLHEVSLANHYLSRAQGLDPAENLRLVQDLTWILETQHLVLQALRPSIPADSQAMVNYLLIAAH